MTVSNFSYITSNQQLTNIKQLRSFFMNCKDEELKKYLIKNQNKILGNKSAIML